MINCCVLPSFQSSSNWRPEMDQSIILLWSKDVRHSLPSRVDNTKETAQGFSLRALWSELTHCHSPIGVFQWLPPFHFRFLISNNLFVLNRVSSLFLVEWKVLLWQFSQSVIGRPLHCLLSTTTTTMSFVFLLKGGGGQIAGLLQLTSGLLFLTPLYSMSSELNGKEVLTGKCERKMP